MTDQERELLTAIADRLQKMEAVWFRMSDRMISIEATQQRILRLATGEPEPVEQTTLVEGEPAGQDAA